MNDTLIDCRAAFEAWAITNGGRKDLNPNGTGGYDDYEAAYAWSAWVIAWNQRPSKISENYDLGVAIWNAFKAKGYHTKDCTRYADIAEEAARQYIKSTEREMVPSKKSVDSCED